MQITKCRVTMLWTQLNVSLYVHVCDCVTSLLYQSVAVCTYVTACVCLNIYISPHTQGRYKFVSVSVCLSVKCWIKPFDCRRTIEKAGQALAARSPFIIQNSVSCSMRKDPLFQMLTVRQSVASKKHRT